jgi:hypothetical protein
MLIAPEGDMSRRRHVHTRCAAAAYEAGRLPTRDDWRRQSGEPGLFARIAARLWGPR